MIRVRLHLVRVDRARIFTDKEGRQCLAFVLLGPENGETRGQVAHSLSPEERATGARGAKCGWWETIGSTKKPGNGPQNKAGNPAGRAGQAKGGRKP
jgi:hypothetical protein